MVAREVGKDKHLKRCKINAYRKDDNLSVVQQLNPTHTVQFRLTDVHDGVVNCESPEIKVRITVGVHPSL